MPPPAMSDRRRAVLGALLLVMPVLFLLALGLRDGLGAAGLFDSMQAQLLGPRQPLARPLTAALIVLGPPLALLLNAPGLVRVRRVPGAGRARRGPRLRWSAVNAVLALGGLAVTGALLAYPLLGGLAGRPH